MEAAELKKSVGHRDVPALHIVEDVVIECPSGLSFAHFLAYSIFSSTVFALCKALEKGFQILVESRERVTWWLSHAALPHHGGLRGLRA